MTTEPRADTAPLAALPGIAAAAMVVVTGVSFLPHSNWWWGINLLHFYPVAFRLGWCAAGLFGMGAAWLLGRRRATAEAWVLPEAAAPIDAPAHPAWWARHPAAAGVAAGVVSGAIFWFFRTHTALLGNGYRILTDLRQWKQPLSLSALYELIERPLAALLRGNHANTTIEQAGALSILVGALVIGLTAFLLVRRVRGGRPVTAAAAAAALLFTQPALQLFAGYVECFSLLGASLLLFLVAAEECVEGRSGPIPAALAGFAAMLSHPFGVAVVAGAIVMLRLAPWDSRNWRHRVAWGLVGPVALVLLAWARRHRSLFGFQPAFSLVQATDLLNHLWLTAAPAILVLAALAASAAGRRALRSPGALTALAVAIPLIAARGVLRTGLGPVRDWDLFSGAGVALTAMAAAAASAALEEAPGRQPGSRLLPAAGLAVVGIFFLVPWLGLQADSNRAVSRHLAVVDAAPKPEPAVAAGFHGAMGDRLIYIGEARLAARAYEKAWRLQPGAFYARRAGMAFVAGGQFESAAGAFMDVTKREPNDWKAWSDLGSVLCSLNDFDQADAALHRALEIAPREPAPRIHLARVLAMRGQDREARLMLESARPLLRSGDISWSDFRVLDANLPPAFGAPAR